VQVGAAVSTFLIGRLGVAGTTWLRLSWAAVALLIIVRPRLRGLTPRALLAATALGATSGLMSLAFFSAVDRLPLGTVVSVEFLGPLSVAAMRSGRRAGLLWPAIALLGVVTLTRPWAQSPSDRIGLLFAAAAATCWGAYVVLTQHVGKQCSGLTGLAISLPVAALVCAPWGIPQALAHLTPLRVLEGAGLAALLPLLPYSAEMFALRMLPPAVFGVWMSIEPAIGTGVGLLVLHQVPDVLQLLGVLLVVIASVGAERSHSTPASTPRRESQDVDTLAK
jgi:inner membrane transporter RhtA